MSAVTSRLLVALKRLKRLPMTVVLRSRVRWQPLADPADGYTVVVACMNRLAPVAVANLRLCATLDRARLRELILVFDCPVDQIPGEVRAAVAAVPTLPVRLLGYSAAQYLVARWINWGWVYAWVSWAVAIGAARTRAVILHDLDALPIGPRLFEQIYDHWLESRAEFCGIRLYRGNGVDEAMGLVTTFELALDAAYVREHFRPFDLFNKVARVDGRVVDFDTTLHAQTRSPRRAVRPIQEDHLVHPSQLICNFTDLTAGRSDFRGRPHLLPLLVYFAHLGGETEGLAAAAAALAADSITMPVLGRTVYVDGVTLDGWAWVEKQARRLEQHCFGHTRPEVSAFLAGVIRRAGSRRTVGNEIGASAVADH